VHSWEQEWDYERAGVIKRRVSSVVCLFTCVFMYVFILLCDLKPTIFSQSLISLLLDSILSFTNFRGNILYEASDHSEAIGSYTEAIRLIRRLPDPSPYLHMASICYCNRAAARMEVGQFADALLDCEIATNLQPGYVKANIRAIK
jgi:tetratricopeptide (TPR) repeat protein